MRDRLTKSYFMDLWKRIELSGSGEPGFYLTNDKDWGTNPCCEIALRPYQFCNLCEVNGSDVESQEQFDERVTHAAFIGTLQASYTSFHYLRSIWQETTEKDALIGVSITGIGSGKVTKLDMTKAANLVTKENKRVAKLLGINSSARSTTVKPAGTTSLTLGTSSGIHAWHNDYYIRRIRVGKTESMYKFLAENHPELIEDEYFRPHDTAVIQIPQKAPEGSVLRTESPISLLERVKLVSRQWVKPGHVTGRNTHNISATVSIRDNEWDEIGEWMWNNKEFYNGLSVLPYNGGTYVQAPFEDITEEKYNDMMKTLMLVDIASIEEDEDETDLTGELACAGGACEIA
jgi:ribonucleoside-diphosphate reductase alpha chain